MIQQQANTITKFDAWVLATRPRTLPAALVPVLVGSSIAINDGMFKPLAAIVALVCAILIQIGTNFVNDLYDFLHGTDKKDRIGPKRVVTSGLISIPEMKLGIIFVFGLSFVLGMYLVHLAGWEILLLGVISILAGIAKTALGFFYLLSRFLFQLN